MQMLKLTKSKIKVSIHSCPLLTKNIEKMAVLIFIFSSSCLNNNKKKKILNVFWLPELSDIHILKYYIFTQK